LNTPADISPLSAFTPVGHALFSKDGVQLAFGRRWDGEIVHISQVVRGKACGCECPAEKCRPDKFKTSNILRSFWKKNACDGIYRDKMNGVTHAYRPDEEDNGDISPLFE
jgi:hypothetical protein